MQILKFKYRTKEVEECWDSDYYRSGGVSCGTFTHIFIKKKDLDSLIKGFDNFIIQITGNYTKYDKILTFASRGNEVAKKIKKEIKDLINKCVAKVKWEKENKEPENGWIDIDNGLPVDSYYQLKPFPKEEVEKIRKEIDNVIEEESKRPSPPRTADEVYADFSLSGEYTVRGREKLTQSEVWGAVRFALDRVPDIWVNLKDRLWVGLSALGEDKYLRSVVFSVDRKNFCYITKYTKKVKITDPIKARHSYNGYTNQVVIECNPVPKDIPVVGIQSIKIPEAELVAKKKKERTERKLEKEKLTMEEKVEDYFRNKYKSSPLFKKYYSILKKYLQLVDKFREENKHSVMYVDAEKEAKKELEKTESPEDLSLLYIFDYLGENSFASNKWSRAIVRELFKNYPAMVVRIEKGRDGKFIARRFDGKIYFIVNLDKIDPKCEDDLAIAKVLLNKEKWGKVKIIKTFCEE